MHDLGKECESGIVGQNLNATTLRRMKVIFNA